MFLSVTFALSSTVVLASGPGTPDSIDGVSQHLSPESSRKAYCRTWEQPSQSASFTHMPQSPNVFNEHMTNNTMSPGTAAQSLKSPASIRSRSVSDSSVPRRGNFSCQYASSVPKIKILITLRFLPQLLEMDSWGKENNKYQTLHVNVLCKASCF